jgi:hypothetical protein
LVSEHLHQLREEAAIQAIRTTIMEDLRDLPIDSLLTDNATFREEEGRTPVPRIQLLQDYPNLALIQSSA